MIEKWRKSLNEGGDFEALLTNLSLKPSIVYHNCLSKLRTF